MIFNGFKVDAFEIMPLASRQDGYRYFMGFGSGKEKHNVGRGLFQCFQESVKGRNAKHMDFIDDVNFVGAVLRHIFNVFTQIPDLINTVV